MIGTRLIHPAATAALITIVVGCTSISATPPPTAVTLSPDPIQSIAASLSPSVVPSSLALPSITPASDLPTIEPSVPPTDTPAPTKTAKPATANLVVTKFELDDNYILVEAPAPFIVTVKNVGSADAGPFSTTVLETNQADGTKGESDPKAVGSGLDAGKSVKVTMSIALPKVGYWTLTANADSHNDVAESNEKDNTQDLNAKVLAGLPDLTWANGEGFSMTASQTKPGYFDVAYDFINTGTDDLAQQTAFIVTTWYRDQDGAMGNLSPVPISDLAKGEERVLESLQPLSGSGTYTIYAYLDGDHVLNELSTDNNETVIHLTIP